MPYTQHFIVLFTIHDFIFVFQCGWYWGPLNWDEAETTLADKSEGSFLVRDSSDDRYILSLSFRCQDRVHHTRIEHHKGIIFAIRFTVDRTDSRFIKSVTWL